MPFFIMVVFLLFWWSRLEAWRVERPTSPDPDHGYVREIPMHGGNVYVTTAEYLFFLISPVAGGIIVIIALTRSLRRRSG